MYGNPQPIPVKLGVVICNISIYTCSHISSIKCETRYMPHNPKIYSLKSAVPQKHKHFSPHSTHRHNKIRSTHCTQRVKHYRADLLAHKRKSGTEARGITINKRVTLRPRSTSTASFFQPVLLLVNEICLAMACVDP